MNAAGLVVTIGGPFAGRIVDRILSVKFWFAPVPHVHT